MQLVGATKNFIRWPFILMAILHGFLAGLVAIALLIGLMYFAQKEVPELVILQNYAEFGIMFAVLIGLGILISLISTYLAVTKYLRLKVDALYI
jgi:cell division transport system permease protein